MSEKQSGIFSQENVSTILAVTFILALVSLAFNFFIFSRQQLIMTVDSAVDVGLADKHAASTKEFNARISALEKEIADLKAKADKMEKAAAEGEAPPAK